jgi:hypothetical protein
VFAIYARDAWKATDKNENCSYTSCSIETTFGTEQHMTGGIPTASV